MMKEKLSTAIDTAIAASRRFRFGGGVTWRRQILAVALLFSAVAMIFAFAVPYPFSIATVSNFESGSSLSLSPPPILSSPPTPPPILSSPPTPPPTLSPTSPIMPPPPPILSPPPTILSSPPTPQPTLSPPPLLPQAPPPILSIMPPPPPPILSPKPPPILSIMPPPPILSQPPPPILSPPTLLPQAPPPIFDLIESQIVPIPSSNPTVSTATTSPPPPFPANPPINSVDSDNVVKSNGGDPKSPNSEPEKFLPLLPRDLELMYAKREIDRAPVVADDPELHAPLFRNMSIFKMSYKLMESILKVYIYQDGAKPIFHQPDLKGIYASEGWFMKLMEGNKKFVVKDPNKAHLFYLPYGARQLQQALYVPDSHNMHPLMLFLKNYVNMLSVKYPFWNRTRGADHFLVACHDWGTYTTKSHEELKKNTIKAVCNADASEGIFIRGKDVSLPETTVRNPKRPLKDIGGKPVSQRSIFAFFAGNMHGRVRPILLKYWSEKDEDMKIYGPLPPSVAKKMSYIQHMKSSKFCICPMGYEVNSPRIVESIHYECVPVIIADNFVLPFEEVLDWEKFSVIVAEKDIPNLKDILLRISPRRYKSMQLNVRRLQKHFLWHEKPIKYDLFHMILHSIWFNRLNQIQIQ